MKRIACLMGGPSDGQAMALGDEMPPVYLRTVTPRGGMSLASFDPVEITTSHYDVNLYRRELIARIPKTRFEFYTFAGAE